MGASTHYEADIAIVGGGIAGCTLAMALAPSYSVIVIDKLAAPVERLGECLAPAARRILRGLGLMAAMEQHRPDDGRPIHRTNMGTRSYWGSDGVHIVDPLRNPDGFGWHLNRQAFEAWLRDVTVQRGIQCLWGMQLHSCQYENAAWQLTTTPAGEAPGANTCSISAKFVVDASGRQSIFARQAGIKRTQFDKLIACWATLPDRIENKMSTISAAEKGWWYTAALPGGKRVLAFHTDPDLVDRDIAKNKQLFLELAYQNREMTEILKNGGNDIDYQGVVAANSTRLDQPCGKQWAAVGDAAMSFDPLSSQGMFNAMAGAMQLAALILEPGPGLFANSAKSEHLQTTHQEQLDQVWQHYVRHKDFFYGQEKRWADSEFWKRRG